MNTALRLHDEARRPPRLAGFVPFSGCDWPGELACVVFVAGCPWRCRYCHNPALQQRASPPGAPQWDELLGWLPTRRGLIDAVVFCGGDPLVEARLPEMLAQVRALGFKTALHTGGAYPARLGQCLPQLDWVGFDVKHDFADYADVTGVASSGVAAQRSLDLLLASGVAFECRTTWHPLLQDHAALVRLADRLAALGVRDYALQCFRPTGCRDDELIRHPVGAPASQLLSMLASRFDRFTLREAA
ncbi:anaerobic ribonucleoside-triphosphate reductase activating protein [Chitinolyticbacter meiyuanensis]|uniref:anaerobic ribonucleoside-triphosphate reductase activating protein n=1 Tax=Chitinolyticbacter meiyuanensis TaxID=682798 RepID=UPI001FEC13F4|nr:anaerobic ribonucleoside-triphosphate reductase activating protein [Chitinolyticbacter meiyuanensis]